MEALTKAEVFEWLRSRSISVTNDGYLYFDGYDRRCIAVELPKKPYRVVALANELLPYNELIPFQGAILWVRQWGIWSELVERSGFRIMEMVRQVHGSSKSLQEAPGYLFDAPEVIDLQVCLLQPLLVGWDAFMVPASGDYIVATSHDETTCILTRTAETERRLLEELGPWNPEKNSDWYFRGLGIPSNRG